MPVPLGREAIASAAKLRTLLGSLRQGDLISLGAVTVVGRGASPVLDDAGVTDVGDLWSFTVESDVGWYVVLSQDCDIVRGREDEPCLLVCPLKYVPEERWLALRHGPSSPREFPYPTDKLADRPGGQRPVADLRFVTSVDKTALLHETVDSLRPLSGRQRERFSAWVGRRFTRAAHDDLVVEDVLGPAGALLRDLRARAHRALAAGKNPTVSGRFVLAIDEWYVGGSDKFVQLHAIVSAASLRAAGLASDAGEVDGAGLEAGRAWVEQRLAAKLPPDRGYLCQLEVWTLDALPASRYRELAPWVFEDPGDPLAD